MVALSRNVARKQAMEMLLTGEMIDAPTPALGLVNRVVPAKHLDEAVDDGQDDRRQVAADAEARQGGVLPPARPALAEAYDYAGRVMVENMLARDAEEGIDAFLQKRAPVWTGT